MTVSQLDLKEFVRLGNGIDTTCTVVKGLEWIVSFLWWLFCGCRMLFTFFGQFLVFVTPSIQMAQIMASGLNALWQLMNGDSSTLSLNEAVVQLKFCVIRLHYGVACCSAFGRHLESTQKHGKASTVGFAPDVIYTQADSFCKYLPCEMRIMASCSCWGVGILWMWCSVLAALRQVSSFRTLRSRSTTNGSTGLRPLHGFFTHFPQARWDDACSAAQFVIVSVPITRAAFLGLYELWLFT